MIIVDTLQQFIGLYLSGIIAFYTIFKLLVMLMDGPFEWPRFKDWEEFFQFLGWSLTSWLGAAFLLIFGMIVIIVDMFIEWIKDKYINSKFNDTKPPSWL